MARNLGEAFIGIRPVTEAFRAQAEAAVKKAVSGIAAEIPVVADPKPLQAQIAALTQQLNRLVAARGVQKLVFNADTTAATAKIAALKSQLISLTLEEARLSKTIQVNADTAPARAVIAAFQARMNDLASQLSALRINADDSQAEAVLAGLQVQLTRLSKIAHKLDVKIDPNGVAALDAQLLAIESRVQAMNRAIADAMKAAGSEAGDAPLGAFTAALGQGVFTAGRFGGVLGFLGGQVTLFGGALNKVLPVLLSSVAVWHIVADAVVEILAVLLPAGVAIGAFAVAASDAFKAISVQVTNMHTVMDATGQAVPPFTNALENLHKAVTPQVFQLFGDAIQIAGAKTGEFSALAKGTATVVDQLAARFTYAVTSGNGMDKFLKDAVPDVAKLGDLIGNLAGAFGNILQVIPGFATHLLSLADGFTKVFEAATRAGEPLIGAALLLHGWILYTGLAVTVSLALTGAVANLAKALVTFAASSVLSGVAAIRSLGAVMAGVVTNVYLAATGLIAMARAEGVAATAASVLSDVPVIVWLTLAAAAIAGLVFLLKSSASATQEWTATLLKTADAVPVMQSLSANLTAQAQATQQLNAAKTQLAKTQQYVTGYGRENVAIRELNPLYAQQAQNVRALAQAKQQLVQQYSLEQSRLAPLVKEYGSTTAALGALNLAGVATSQITDKNAQHWAQALIQVNATAAGYKAMGVQAGTLGNDLEVLGVQSTDQYTAIQKLNTAWSTFIGNVTGTQTTFDTVAQGYATLSSQAGTLHQHLGLLTVAYADSKAAIDSLTPQGIALNQAFGDQITNLDKMYASWRTAGLAQDLFTQGVKDSIAPLLTYAKGSQEATAQLVALAEEAGYQGPATLAALTKWLGNTSDATKNLKTITNQATLQEALLTSAMQAQGNLIASQLIGDINNAVLKYNHVQQAAAAYGNAIAKSGQQSDAAKGSRHALILDLINAGTAAGDSTRQIAALIAKVLGIPAKRALQIVMTGDGSYTVGQKFSTSSRGVFAAAAGGLISRGTGPAADDVPIMASRGEFVMKAAAVSKYGTAMMHAVNAGKFASGGLVEGGNTNVLSGQQAVTDYNKFTVTMTNSMTAAMKSALRSAQAAAAAATAGGGGTAPNVAAGSVAALMKSMAASLYKWTGTQWNALYNVEEREAGFNLNAKNPSSGAYGLAQFISGPAEYYQYGGNPNTASGQITAMLAYIRQRYGSPASAWAHEQNFGWYNQGGLVGASSYDRGGFLPRGLSLAYNGTGSPEPVGGGAGVTQNITVTVNAPSGNAAQIGAAIASYLRAYQQAGGKITAGRRGADGATVNVSGTTYAVTPGPVI